MTDTTKLRELLAKATPGPWRTLSAPGRHLVHTPRLHGHSAACGEREDADLIAAMHAALPALLDAADEVVRLRAEVLGAAHVERENKRLLDKAMGELAEVRAALASRLAVPVTVEDLEMLGWQPGDTFADAVRRYVDSQRPAVPATMRQVTLRQWIADASRWVHPAPLENDAAFEFADRILARIGPPPAAYTREDVVRAAMAIVDHQAEVHDVLLRGYDEAVIEGLVDDALGHAPSEETKR